MLKGRGRDPRQSAMPAHLARLQSTQAQPPRTPQPLRGPLAKPEPDYEVVEFPSSEQYVNAKLQPPPPPPPRPPTGHPIEAGASCGLCGGGGARVRCTECGRRALCASCDDMYHRHPKRRNHQRQALTSAQIREERPPLPPKTTPPVPPPRRHKLAGDRSSASPRPPNMEQQRRATIGHISTLPAQHTTNQNHAALLNNHSQHQQLPPHLQGKLTQQPPAPHLGSMPYLPNVQHPGPPVQQQMHHANTLANWGRQRGSLQAFNMHPNMQAMPAEAWESPESASPSGQTSPWGRPLRRGASVLELGGGAGGAGAVPACAGCAHCAPGWRYGSCASLDHSPWPGAWAPACCVPPAPHHMHPHQHMHAPYTPQPHRRVESRAASRAASRAGSRAASPAMSVRSRASRRTKHRTPSPPSLPSSDADSESESDRPPPVDKKDYREQQRKELRAQQEKERKEVKAQQDKKQARVQQERKETRAVQQRKEIRSPTPQERSEAAAEVEIRESSLGPAPPPPDATWQCEFCTFVNEPGVRVCAVCCRTPTEAPRVVASTTQASPRVTSPRAATPQRVTSPPRALTPQRVTSPPPTEAFHRLTTNDKSSPARSVVGDNRANQNGDIRKPRQVREKISTGCGPSPPRENNTKKPLSRLVTPTRETDMEARTRHDMCVGPSPPRETRHNAGTGPSPPRESRIPPDPPVRHSISVGLSPPRSTNHSMSVGSSPPRITSSFGSVQKMSAGTSPPRSAVIERPAIRNVSNTGTSPPPQNISTQTYEAPSSWERAPSASRARRRLRADRERSHSRHSLSSDTRQSNSITPAGVTCSSYVQESDRSARTSGGGAGGSAGRWEWRETRDSSPPECEWSGSERRPRLARRASHLDLRRRPARRAGYCGSEAASPERMSSNRALSMEALAGGARREAECGLELARLMTDAERLGFSAAEVHAALAQNPVAPLTWLRERWPSLVAGVRAAAARLAPGAGAAIGENEARAALARHRGAMWPAVTDCVERHRRQAESLGLGEERRLRGRVWGSPAGADDEAAPPPRAARPRSAREEDSSDEYEAPIPMKDENDDWMYLPLDPLQTYDIEPSADVWNEPPKQVVDARTEDIALKLKSFLIQAGVPAIDENLLLKGLLANNNVFKSVQEGTTRGNRPQSIDLAPFENDFIDAYNALTRSSPLPNINNKEQVSETLSNDLPINTEIEDLFLPKENVLQNLHSPDDVQNSEVEITVNPNTNETRNIVENITSPIVNIKSQNSVENITGPALGENSRNNVEYFTNSIDIDITNTETIKESAISKSNTETLTKAEAIPSNSKKNSIAPQPSQHSDSSNNEIGEPKSQITKTNLPSKTQKHKVIQKSDSSLKSQRRKAPPRSERSTPEEEKLSNLSTIVGDTQRLIQQMKEEINSDINSIDGHSMSQSEADYSSNESEFTSEHESSYSDTDDTEDITSDENDETSTDEDENVESQRSGTAMNRTSSEENEQFEEAMDHIEEQNESFKQTNIQILDSIVRSLQEDHTLSLEIKQNLQGSELEGETQNSRIPDLEDKVPVPMNSDQSTIVPIAESAAPRPYSPVNSVLKQPKTASVSEQSPNTLEVVLPPAVTLQVSEVVTPKTKKQDINNNIFIKVNSFDEIYDQLSSTSSNTTENVHVDNKQSQNSKSKKKSRSQKSPVTDQQPIITKEVVSKPTVALQKQEMTVSAFNVDAPTRLIITDELRQAFNAVINTIDASQTDNSKAETVDEEPENLVNYIKVVEENSPNGKQNASGGESSEDSASEYSNSDASRRTISPMKEIVSTKDNNISEQKNANNTDNAEIQPLKESNDKHVITDTVNEAEVKAKNQSPEKQKSKTPEKQNSKSPEKQLTNTRYDSKTPTVNKSQIPKLVKVPPTKQKVDKSSTKVIASKVPVRRGSIKQYPAPSPPKFSNVQNGHVKQLQTRLFNNKAVKVLNTPPATEPQPSTSTLNKKRPAPQPPSTSQAKQPQKATPPKERKHYFRETCRTEDEWTESDSEDSILIVRQDSSEPIRPPSPPPPITLRRVSGQLIDLARISLLEGSPERQARMLLADGALENWEQAQLAVELVSRGTEPPAALLAALECVDLDSALTYLHQDCELCASRLPEHEMVSMLRCTHRCCRECARHYFTVQITERSIADCVCPYCKEPELEDLPEDAWLEYFAHLDILLKTLLDNELHELFQRKLRDRTLARDPNFRWCVECSSGFFVHPKHKKLRCPECKSVSCAKCRKPWTSNHEGLSCEQYATWLEDNDPERSVAAVQQHLRENGLECPRCRFKYSLSRGGCMHFTCTQCKYEFCYGCGKPFMMGARCGLSEYCARLGLHAHHPRNCLFYLRDKQPHDLQTLLQMNNISYETKAPEGNTSRCPIQLQKETPTGLVDAACGHDVPPEHAGLCKNHYLEYLSRLVRSGGVDPWPLLGVDDLETLVRRAALRLPPRPYGTLEGLYKRALLEIVREKIPLE